MGRWKPPHDSRNFHAAYSILEDRERDKQARLKREEEQRQQEEVQRKLKVEVQSEMARRMRLRDLILEERLHGSSYVQVGDGFDRIVSDEDIKRHEFVTWAIEHHARLDQNVKGLPKATLGAANVFMDYATLTNTH